MTPDLTDLEWLRSQIIGVDATIRTPYGDKPMLYADYTASGRALRFIEEYLCSLLPLYANSHTEDDLTGRVTTGWLHQAEERVKQLVNAGPDGRIIAFGTGATAAIDRMQQLVGVKQPAASRALLDNLLEGFLGREQAAAFRRYRERHQPVVFVGPYEHHSNEISWREGMCTVVEVQMTADGAIDLEHLEQLLQDPAYRDRLRIGSFSAASNVTGMISPVHRIASLLHRHDALAFFDYAASAPYVPIDMNPGREEGDHLDAVFLSPHKFLGGPGASGLLIFNRRCYRTDLPPSMAGGGTVEYVGPEDHDFLDDIEEREKAGTPGILQTIRAALVMELKQAIGSDTIERRERAMVRQAFARWGAHPRIEILGNQDPERRVGIVSLNIRDHKGQYLHPRFVTTLLNDLFGIQSRAGCSCAGPYGHKLLDISPVKAAEYRSWITRGYHGIKPGWCRVGFHFVFDQPEVEYLLSCMEFVADHGHRFVHHYDFDAHSGNWSHKQGGGEIPSLSLQAALAPEPAPPALDREARQARYRMALEQAKALL